MIDYTMHNDPRLTRNDTHIKTRLYVLAKDLNSKEHWFSCDWKYVEGEFKRADVIEKTIKYAKMHGEILSFLKVVEEIQDGYLNQSYLPDPCFCREISKEFLSTETVESLVGKNISDINYVPINFN